MAILALAAPVNFISDINLASGVTLPAAETALGANTGCTFPNVPAGHVLLRVVVDAAGACNITIVGQNSAANKVIAAANSTIYILGPFDPSLWSDSAALIHVNFNVSTGNSVGVYKVPEVNAPSIGPGYQNFYRPLHSPFETNEGSNDW